jgi:TatA/E family protein of Tat protein translocase
MSLGTAEILVVLVVALVLFGPKLLPERARRLGEAGHARLGTQDVVEPDRSSILPVPHLSAPRARDDRGHRHRAGLSGGIVR